MLRPGILVVDVEESIVDAMAPGTRVRIVDGAFAGTDAVVTEVREGTMTVAFELFGRTTRMELPSSHVERPGDDPRPRLRKAINRDAAEELERTLHGWWTVRLGQPESDLAAEWRAFLEFRAAAEQASTAQRDELLRDFDETFNDDASSAADGPEAIEACWAEQADRWIPHRARWTRETEWVREGLRSTEDTRRAAAEAEVALARQRRTAATTRRQLAEYLEYRRVTLPDPTTLTQSRAQGRREAAAVAGPLRALVRRTHGLALPDSLFRFWAFWQALTPVERAALENCVGVRPGGVLDLAARLGDGGNEPATRDGLDARLDCRFYCDPPEFLTVLWGEGDGHHFGLWFDDPDQPADLVASYYSRDGGGISWAGSTLLEAVRDRVEWVQFHVDHAAGKSDDELREQRLAVQLARDAVMEFETGDRPERGAAYHDRYPVRPPGRIPTVSEAGVRVPGQPGEAPRDTETVSEEILHDASRLADRVRAALDECAEGRPGEALALGHDLHWLSAGDPVREGTALRLLDTAYRQLGRDALAGIAAVHHRHRNLRSVAVYLD